MLFREGDPRSFFAVILSGSVAVEHAHGSAGGLRIATLGAGEVLGEGMLLDDSPHGTAARALVRTETLVFHKEQVDPLLKDKPYNIAIEPGRYIVGNAGIVLTRVLYRKQSGEKRWTHHVQSLNL